MAIKSVCTFFLFQFLLTLSMDGQQIVRLSDSSKVSIRGLSVVNDHLIWVSGTGGKVGKSINGGRSWEWNIVPGFEKRDFRDIEAFDEKTAIIIAVAEPANILKTTDGGKTWRTVFTDTAKGMFLDALDFTSNGAEGVVIGDPMQERLFMARTKDMGDHWLVESANKEPVVENGEALFAASGTNIKLFTNDNTGALSTIFVSGGKKSRLFYNNISFNIPMIEGQESTGANGLDLWNNRSGVIVGGDFAKDSTGTKNCVLFELDPEIRLSVPQTPPHGYRSAVAYLDANRLIACGTSGIDISEDGGKNWKLISREAYHVCKKAKKGNTIFLAGPMGKIAKLVW
ncbi:MAG: WD40/YVTN/BNR-like repeat-containing protein [Chitinophagales bacterium]